MMTPREVDAADGADVVDQAALVRLGQVRRQEQDAVGAGGLGGLGVFDGLGGGAAGGGQDRDDAADFLDGGADHALGLGRGEGEALAGAAGGEESGHREAGLPGEVLAVVLLVELQLCVERGDGEGEQAVLEGVGQFLGCVFCHGVVLRVGAESAEVVWFPFRLGMASHACPSAFLYALIPFSALTVAGHALSLAANSRSPQQPATGRGCSTFRFQMACSSTGSSVAAGQRQEFDPLDAQRCGRVRHEGDAALGGHQRDHGEDLADGVDHVGVLDREHADHEVVEVPGLRWASA